MLRFLFFVWIFSWFRCKIFLVLLNVSFTGSFLFRHHLFSGTILFRNYSFQNESFSGVILIRNFSIQIESFFRNFPFQELSFTGNVFSKTFFHSDNIWSLFLVLSQAGNYSLSYFL